MIVNSFALARRATNEELHSTVLKRERGDLRSLLVAVEVTAIKRLFVCEQVSRRGGRHETAGRQLWNVAMVGITDNLEKFKKFSQTFDVKRLT